MKSFSAGADDFIPKPYLPDEIFAALENAETWKAQLDSSHVDGEASLDGSDECQTLRSLARLRNALLARSGLELEAIDEIYNAITAFWLSSREWVERHASDGTATLKYSLNDSSLELCISDQGGWLLSRLEREGHPGLGLLDSGLFDQVITDSASRSLRFVKQFPPR
jgi:hypothetical protein